MLCKYKNVKIVAGAVCEDHVHLSVAIPPKISISNFMGYLKGKSTLMMYDRHPELQSKCNKAFTLMNKQKIQEKKIWEVPLCKRISNGACDIVLRGEQ